MQPNEYQQLALRTEYTPDVINVAGNSPDENRRLARLLHGMIGKCTETGELQDMVKKHLIYGKSFDRVNVLEECGDTLWYIAIALDACGFTFEECMFRNIEKLRARYPDKFTSEAAINRDERTERAVLEGQFVTIIVNGWPTHMAADPLHTIRSIAADAIKRATPWLNDDQWQALDAETGEELDRDAPLRPQLVGSAIVITRPTSYGG